VFNIAMPFRQNLTVSQLSSPSVVPVPDPILLVSAAATSGENWKGRRTGTTKKTTQEVHYTAALTFVPQC
jgi:hypothetical protein